MHKIKSAARKCAWYRQQDDHPSHKFNPFMKSKSDLGRNSARDLEGAGRPRARVGIHDSDLATPSSSTPEQRSTTPNDVEKKKSAGPEQALDVEVPTSRDLGSKPKPRHRFLNKFSTTHVKNNADDLSDDFSTRKKQHYSVLGQIRAAILNSPINVLLVAVPIGIALKYAHVDPVAVFIVNFVAIVPLAGLLSYATEEIAITVGETLGGLLNASFGNAVELIVSILALVKNEVLIVQTSLIGSILSNLLLVMGMSFFFGGIPRVEQFFNITVAQTASSMLALAVGSLIIPTAFHSWSGAGERGIKELSRGTSIILLIVYGSYLFFQLKTHATMYNKPSQKAEKRSKGKSETTAGVPHADGVGGGSSGRSEEDAGIIVAEDEPEEPQLRRPAAIILLAVATTLVALCAEFMVSSIDALTDRAHISKTFVGLILLPIVGNAAEHATAVTVACKDKMDLAIGVAIGSSMQIALLVLPLSVTLGWILHKDAMTLYFDGFQIAVLFVSVLLVNYLIQDGKSNWLEGVLLMATYILISIAAWFYPTHEAPRAG